MNIKRKNQAVLILCTLTKLLKEFKFGLEIFKDGSIAFVDIETGNRYKISAKDFQDLYDKTEVEEWIAQMRLKENLEIYKS